MSKKLKFLLLAFIIVFHLVNNFIWITASPFHCATQGKDWQTHARNYAVLIDRLSLQESGQDYNCEKSFLYNFVY